jgi:hypothetical protein
MSDQLRDRLTRIAEEAGPGRDDPNLWARARRSRRQGRRAMAAAAVAVVVLVVMAATVGGRGSVSRSPEPVDRPTKGAGGPGIPSSIHGVRGDGGLKLERDLAVGRASVAIANDTGAFVITADDGIYHRLDLPGFDAAVYDSGGVEASGLALSPDGSRIAYGWHAERTQALPKASGVRIVDLLTCTVTTLPRQFTYNAPARQLVWGLVWSPDGRFLFNRLQPVRDFERRAWTGAGGLATDAGFDTSYNVVVDTGERATRAGLSPGVAISSTGAIARIMALVDYPDPDQDWEARFDATGHRLLIAPKGVVRSLQALRIRPTHPISRDGPIKGDTEAAAVGPPTVLAITGALSAGARIQLLGWVGDGHALALAHHAAGTDHWEPGADLALLAIGSAGVDTTVVGHVTNDDLNNDFSFATDLATVADPTRDFGASPTGGDIRDVGASPTGGDESSPTGPSRTVLLTGVAAGVAAVGALAIWLTRRRAPQR